MKTFVWLLAVAGVLAAFLAGSALVRADDDDDDEEDAAAVKAEVKKLVGTWKLVKVEVGGEAKKHPPQILVIESDKLTFTTRYSDIKEIENYSDFKLKVKKDQKTIGFEHHDAKQNAYDIVASYATKEDRLVFGVNKKNSTKAPSGWDTKEDANLELWYFKK